MIGLGLSLLLSLAAPGTVGDASADAPAGTVDSGAGDPPVVGREAESARLASALAIAAITADGRFEAELYAGELDRDRCLREPACLSALADAASARFILWGEVGAAGERRALSVELFDTRTGATVARESVQRGSDAPIAEEVPSLVASLLARVERLELARGRSAKILVVPFGPPLVEEDDDGTLHRPTLLALSGVLGAGAAVAAAASGTLFALAWEQDQRAAAAVYQVDAASFVETRNNLALGGMMAGATFGAFLLYSGVGLAFWALEPRLAPTTESRGDT